MCKYIKILFKKFTLLSFLKLNWLTPGLVIFTGGNVHINFFSAIPNVSICGLELPATPNDLSALKPMHMAVVISPSPISCRKIYLVFYSQFNLHELTILSVCNGAVIRTSHKNKSPASKTAKTCPFPAAVSPMMLPTLSG